MMNNRESKKDLSLYIHVPFCVRKCLYCDFLSFASDENTKNAYVDDLCQEITAYGKMLRGEYTVRSIFFGGGTPTCLPPESLEKIANTLNKAFSISSQKRENGKAGYGSVLDDSVEFTVEANPGTITKEHIKAFQRMGVNRVSLGLQSMQDEELRCLGRIHTTKEFFESFALLRQAGFHNINIDLMEDIPKQTVASYQNTLEQVLRLQPEHISSYSLIVEPGTPFYEMQKKGELDVAKEDDDRKMYHLTKEYLAKHGYHRYEISNYAREGRECYHNKTYWNMAWYLGMGLGASSYFGGYRFTNQNTMPAYHEYCVEMVRKASEDCFWDSEKQICTDSSLPRWHLQQKMECTKETKTAEMEEFMFLGLRMMEGISKQQFFNCFGMSVIDCYGSRIIKLKKEKLLSENENSDRIYLTDRGIDLSNAVLAEFLDPDEV